MTARLHKTPDRSKSLLLALMLLALPATLQASAIERSMDDALDKLVQDFTKRTPVTGMKKGLSVLPFEEQSADAKARGLGTTLQEIASRRVVNSTVFYLIDRQNLKERLDEIALSMTGLFDDSAIAEAGKQIGVQFFIAGNVTDEADNYRISLRLIDVSTGRVISMQSFLSKKQHLQAAQRDIAFSYIAQHGIGINYQQSWAFFSISGVEDVDSTITDIFTSYRPWLWLNVKFGISIIDVDVGPQINGWVNTASLFPNYTDPNTPDPYISSQTGYNQARMLEVAPYLGIEYNHMFTEKFSVAAGISITQFLTNPTLEQIYVGAPFRSRPVASLPEETEFIQYQAMKLVQTFEQTTMVRVEVKPQYFITPRATVGLYLAGIFTPALTVHKTDYGHGLILYPNEPEGNSDPGDRNFGFNPKQFGLEKNTNVEEAFNLTGFAAGFAIGFFF